MNLFFCKLGGRLMIIILYINIFFFDIVVWNFNVCIDLKFVCIVLKKFVIKLIYKWVNIFF